jgi:hypothetical protein
MAIDTVLAPPLFHLPPEHVHHLIRPGAPPLPPELAVRTLLRGHAVAVPSGEFVAERLGREPLRGPKPPHYAVDPWQRLDDYGFNNATPLWYYVLLEAELEERGKNLGTVGSQLVGEVLEGALRTDASSFLRQNRAGWRPEPWSASDGRSVTINWLLDIAKLVGLADWR